MTADTRPIWHRYGVRSVTIKRADTLPITEHTMSETMHKTRLYGRFRGLNPGGEAI